MATASARSTESGARALRPDFTATVTFWIATVIACTLLLLWLRPWLDKAQLALAFLLVVLGAGARAGGRAGLIISILCFLSFNFFLLPPYYTFVIADPLDWLILLSFLITGGVASALLSRAQRQAREAESRAAEVSRFAELGAETLGVATAEDAVRTVARIIRDGLDAHGCGLSISRDDGAFELLADLGDTSQPPAPHYDRVAIERAAAVVLREDGAVHLAAIVDGLEAVLGSLQSVRALVVPLRVRERAVGTLRLAQPTGGRFTPRSARFAAALAGYAALALERVRLFAEVERAAVLRETDRMKDALVASVSHDLRTPLTTIRALAAEVRADGDERAAVIEEEADRLNRLVADLLDLSRIRAGSLRPEPELNVADDLLGSALQQLRGREDAARVHASLDDAGELLLGRFDLTHSLRVLVNLIENALEYSPPDVPVEVRAFRDGEWLVVEVADRGPGVASDDVDAIFRPFHRGVAEAGVRAGAGLGLAIARSLAEAQGGSLEYAPREGGGSVFRFRLPVADAAPPS